MSSRYCRDQEASVGRYRKLRNMLLALPYAIRMYNVRSIHCTVWVISAICSNVRWRNNWAALTKLMALAPVGKLTSTRVPLGLAFAASGLLMPMFIAPQLHLHEPMRCAVSSPLINNFTRIVFAVYGCEAKSRVMKCIVGEKPVSTSLQVP